MTLGTVATNVASPPESLEIEAMMSGHVLESGMEAMKNEIAQSLLKFSSLLTKTKLIELVSSRRVEKPTKNGVEGGKIERDVEFIRTILEVSKLYTPRIKCELGCALLSECDNLIREVFNEVDKVSDLSEDHEDSKTVSISMAQSIILPVIQLVHDCLELNSSVGKVDQRKAAEINYGYEHVAKSVNCAVRIFGKCIDFLVSACSKTLQKATYLRVLTLCRKVWRFIEDMKLVLKAEDIKLTNEQLKEQIEKVEDVLCGDGAGSITTMLQLENGRSFVKFWCETLAARSHDGGTFPRSLNSIPGATTENIPELYMVLSMYLDDSRFWKTEAGKTVTPNLIATILKDMGSDKPETKKRAAFVLQAITALYSMNKPVFDSSVPEVSYVTLNNMEKTKYKKFWSYYFDLYDILNETQVHIIHPVLHKFSIFHELSTNETVFIWFPILLTKMITHDNRTIVKEGLDQFLGTGKYLVTQNSDDYGLLAEEFLDKHVMWLIKDHIGWVLSEPPEFFANITLFGKFLIQLYSRRYPLPHFQAAVKILTFLTSSGKCMSSHAIFFLVSTLDEAMNFDFDPSAAANNLDIIVSNVETCMGLLAYLVSNSVTTISKYFRELLEHRCVSSLFKMVPYIQHFPELQLTSIAFLKLLTFLGSLSEAVFLQEDLSEKIHAIAKMYNEKGPTLLRQLTSGSTLYEFAKENLSPTSSLGLLRFLLASCEIPTTKLNVIHEALFNFSEHNVREELVKGSAQGIGEFYSRTEHQEKSLELYQKLADLLKNKVAIKSMERMIKEDFMFCIRCIEILKYLPQNSSKVIVNLTSLGESVDDPLLLFLIRKLYAITKNSFECMASVHDLEAIDRIETVENMESIATEYFLSTDRNLCAETHELKFFVYNDIVKDQRNLGQDLQLKILGTILDTIEKCHPKGIAAGLELAKSVIQFVQFEEKSEIAHCLENIASIGWRLVFELRKNESFWNGFNAFVDFICCPYFIQSGDLQQYSEVIFEHAEAIYGLSLFFVQKLVQVEFPEDSLKDAHKVLVQAALAGASMPKNNRISFALWDYLRNQDKKYNVDPENFSSDCKARILACERIRSDIERLRSNKQTREVADNLLNFVVIDLLDRNDSESKTRKRYFGGSLTHRIKQRIFQLLLLLQPYFSYDVSKIVLDRILYSLSTDSPQPSVRYMGEWLVTLIVEQHPQLHTIFFECLNNCLHTRVGFGAFFSTISAQATKHLKSTEFYDKALQTLSTLTLSQHVTVRIYAQVAFQKIYARAKDNNFDLIVHKFSPVLTSLLDALAHVSGNCSKLLENISQDFYVNYFDSKTHYCHEVIFSLLPRMAGMIKDECILHPDEISELMRQLSPEKVSRIGSPVKAIQAVYLEHEKSAWHLKTVVADGRELGDEMPNESISTTKIPSCASQCPDDEMNFQKKINPWKLLSVTDELENYSNFNTKKRCVNEDGLVVVASLLDHLPNLGGLCRTCEIFGANKYVVNSLKVINDQQFQSLSVSAQNWVNILEVPVRDLESFLLTYSAKGYAILGVEQANESTALTNFTFPKKSVLLLGNEKLGIPTELLRLVDKCIEIPQVGIIRSLNVHVTGALCIWKYASQNTF